MREGGMMLAGGAIVGSPLSVERSAQVGGSDALRVGLIGCGGRGTAAAVELLNCPDGNVRLVAMADVFANQIQRSYRTLKGVHADKVDLAAGRFVGLQAYQDVMASDVDLVLLATPPGFRPSHFEAAVRAGKHVFMEKPVATDVAGVARVLAAGREATRNGVAVQVGLQRRHELRYRQCIDRLRSGAIGELLLARIYWNGGSKRLRPRRADQSELEYQLRNWHHFTWLSGDHVCEHHVHNLDVINWLKGSHPIAAQGQGGRAERAGDGGQVLDHHGVEYTYADGFKVFSQCRQVSGCWTSIGEHVHGTAGSGDIGNGVLRGADGRLIWKFDGPEIKGRGWQRQQNEWIDALRSGDRPNQTEYAAISTMTAILGRMATYSGQLVRWDEATGSGLALADVDRLRNLDDPAPTRPGADGRYQLPRPGSDRRPS
jgi:predicted dehydrogenase